MTNWQKQSQPKLSYIIGKSKQPCLKCGVLTADKINSQPICWKHHKKNIGHSMLSCYPQPKKCL